MVSWEHIDLRVYTSQKMYGGNRRKRDWSGGGDSPMSFPGVEV